MGLGYLQAQQCSVVFSIGYSYDVRVNGFRSHFDDWTICRRDHFDLQYWNLKGSMLDFMLKKIHSFVENYLKSDANRFFGLT